MPTFLKEHATPDDLVRDLLGRGYDLAGAHATATRALRLIELSEWKRYQVPVRVKVTRLTFGRDRRVPLANARRYTPTLLADFDTTGAGAAAASITVTVARAGTAEQAAAAATASDTTTKEHL